MAGNIPTIVAGDNTQTRELHVSNQGGGLAILAGSQLIARGAMDMGSAAANIARHQQETAAKLKHLDDIRWATEATQTEQLHLANFMADEANQRSEDFSDRVAQFTKHRMEQYSSQEQAPSPQAFRLFEKNFNHLATQSQMSAIEIGAKNKVNGIITSAKTSIAAAQDAFRSLRSVNEKQALNGMVNSIAQIKSAIDAGIGQFAPDQAHKLHEDLITQSVLNVMGTNPKAAQTILDSSKEIDEQTRYTLSNEIRQASRNIVTGQRNQVLDKVKGIESFARQGNIVNPLSKEDFLQVLPEAQALDAYEDHVRQIKIYNDGNTIVQTVGKYNRDAINRTINSLMKPEDLTTENAVEKEALAKYVVPQLQKIVKLQEEDPAAFTGIYNSHVRGLYDFASTVQDPEQHSAALTTANDTNLLYQGPPPQGVSKAEASLYLDLPLNGRHLLSSKSAEEMAATINMATPKEVVKKIGETLSAYPKPEHAAKVFNDLVSLGKLNQEYQFAWLNRNAPWIDTYVGALQAGNSIKMPEKTIADTAQAVWNDPSFVNLRETITRDNYQGSKDVAGFYEGAKRFAVALQSNQGFTMKDAVTAATTRLIDEQLGFTTVNDKKLMILKKDADGRTRKQSDIDNIGSNLKYALEEVPVHEIELTPFYSTPGFKELPLDQQYRQVGNYLNQRAFWQMLDNGQGAVLYARDPQGIQNFQLRDKQGKPFVVHFRDLPDLRYLLGRDYIEQAMAATRAGATTYPVRRPTYNASQPRPSWMPSE